MLHGGDYPDARDRRGDRDSRPVAIPIITIFSGMRNRAIDRIPHEELREQSVKIGQILPGVDNQPGWRSGLAPAAPPQSRRYAGR
ncbi:MAG: hypothetical protein WCX22_08745 [Methanoregula sp.]